MTKTTNKQGDKRSHNKGNSRDNEHKGGRNNQRSSERNDSRSNDRYQGRSKDRNEGRNEDSSPKRAKLDEQHNTEVDLSEKAGFICGRNAVFEALKADSPANKLLLAEGIEYRFANEILDICQNRGIPYQFIPKQKLNQVAGPDNRGIALELAPYHYSEIEDMLAAARAKNEQPLLIMLDNVEDPHNLGAIIRTAVCVGAHGLIIPKRRSASLTPTVVKTSAGASAYLPVARVANLNQTAADLKKEGLWLAAADMGGKKAWQTDLNMPLVLIMGGEGKGISPLLKKNSDFLISLPLAGAIQSLNVSAAAAALLYEVLRQREL